MLKKLSEYLFWKLSGSKTGSINSIIYITESRDWVISRVGGYIAAGLDSSLLSFKIDRSSRYYFNSLIHFGSAYGFSVDGFRDAGPSNKLIVTVFHGDYGINAGMDYTINKIIEHKERISRIVVANSIMKKRVASWGFPEERVTLIPLGVDLFHFKPDPSRKIEIRKKLGVPEDAVCIGSFEKDGDGWGEGLVPKLIKGPDIFVEVIRQLAGEFKIHCLLTGPARGYVKQKLSSYRISFSHNFLNNYLDIVDYYKCLDMYLVTSRDQGGPKTIIESMAMGVPVVSTRVGMATDVIMDGQNGLIADIDDVNALVRSSQLVLRDLDLRKRIIQGGSDTIPEYDWPIISKKYESLYKEIIQ